MKLGMTALLIKWEVLKSPGFPLAKTVSTEDVNASVNATA